MRSIFVLLLLVFSPLACISDYGCGDLSSYPKIVAIKDLAVEPIKVLYSRGQLQFEDKAKPDSLGYYPKDSLGFLLEIISTEKIATSRKTMNLGSRLWACSPVPPELANPLQKITVTALNEFWFNDETGLISAGDTISQLFEFNALGHSFDAFRGLELLDEADLQEYQSLIVKLQEANRDSLILEVSFHLHLNDGSLYNFPPEIMRILPAQ